MELNYCLLRITCVVCEIVIRPPYTTCRAGHLVCHICQSCTRLAQGFVEESTICEFEKIELPFLDIVFFNVQDNCQFDCGHRGNLMTLLEHELSCKNRFRKEFVECLMESCNWSDVLDKLADHVSEDHPNRLVVLADTPEQGFFANFENPTMLITQFSINSPFNELYRLKLATRGRFRRVSVQHVGHIGPEIDVNDTMNEFTISESSIKHFKVGTISNVDIYSSSNNNNNSITMGNKTIDITALENDNYLVKLRNKNSKKIPQDMMKYFECEICYDLMRGKIPQCDNGHSMCEKCTKRVNLCPKCNAQVNNTRNYSLEQLIESYDVPCKFNENGCAVSGSPQIITSHILSCIYRSTECILLNCTWRGLIKDVMHHIAADHVHNIVTINEPFHIQFLNVNLYYVRYISFYDQLFIFTVLYLYDYVYFSLFHLTEDKSDYNYSVTLTNCQTGFSIAFSNHCFSTSTEEIKTNAFKCENSYMITKKYFVDVLCKEEEEYCGLINITRNI